jgi:hypothetical protein
MEQRFEMEQRFNDQLDEIEEKREALEVRYIKLGTGGDVADDCFKDDLLYIGYDTHLPEVREWCNQARDVNKRDLAIHKIQNYWIEKRNKKQGTATNFTNSVLSVSEDEGKTLWFTVHERKIYYGLTEGGELEYCQTWEDNGSNSGSAKRMQYGWCDRARDVSLLYINKLSGSLTKTQATRGAIALIQKSPAEYFINHLLGKPQKLKALAKKARDNLKEKLANIIKDLQPSEFEVLVDLIFANSGWKRDGELGGNIKFVDVTLMLPSTGETAAVQVKTKTSKSQSQQYIDVDYSSQGFDKFFYVYHTGEAITRKKDKKYFVWGVEEVADKSIDAGLSQWIIDRAYR